MDDKGDEIRGEAGHGTRELRLALAVLIETELDNRVSGCESDVTAGVQEIQAARKTDAPCAELEVPVLTNVCSLATPSFRSALTSRAVSPTARTLMASIDEWSILNSVCMVVDQAGIISDR
jgi:hypothetical protein